MGNTNVVDLKISGVVFSLGAAVLKLAVAFGSQSVCHTAFESFAAAALNIIYLGVNSGLGLILMHQVIQSKDPISTRFAWSYFLDNWVTIIAVAVSVWFILIALWPGIFVPIATGIGLHPRAFAQ